MLLLAEQSRAQTLVAGSCAGAGAAGAPSPFPVAGYRPQSKDPACACLLPWTGVLQSWPAPVRRGLGAPSPFAHAGCSAVAHVKLLKDCERRGLWSWMFPWLPPLGARAGQGRGLGWTHLPTASECNQGLYCGTSSKSGGERAVSGLLLGRATPGEGSAVSWLQSSAFHPAPMGAPRMGLGPVLQRSARVEEQRCPPPGGSREVTCCHQVAFFCCQHLGSGPAPVPVCGCELGPRRLPCSGLLVALWCMRGPAGALNALEGCEGRALPPAQGKRTVAAQGPSKLPAGSSHLTVAVSV